MNKYILKTYYMKERIIPRRIFLHYNHKIIDI